MSASKSTQKNSFQWKKIYKHFSSLSLYVPEATPGIHTCNTPTYHHSAVHSCHALFVALFPRSVFLFELSEQMCARVCVCVLFISAVSVHELLSSACSSAEKWVKFTVEAGRCGDGANSSPPLIFCLWILKQQTVSEDRFISFKR